MTRSGHAAAWTGDELLIYGGVTASGLANDTYAYSPGKTYFIYQRR